jgi:hypothetical protein
VAKVTIDSATGALVTGGRKVFPIALSNAPPADRARPGGGNGLAAVAAAGVSIVRTGIADWNSEFAEGQIAQERAKLDAAATHGLLCWVWLGDLPDLPAGTPPGPRERLLVKVVNALKSHAALGAWKGVDEPRNRFRGENWIRPAGLVRGYQRVKALDPNHPLVITHAPGSPATQLTPYRPACDITGADIYPVSYPPGIHSDTGNRDLSLVGDVTKTLRTAAGPKPVWMTLQIAWSGVVPSRDRPGLVPRFPSLHDERFMAYQAIVNGARGLAFFGGHLTQVTTPADAKAGWNWTFWDRVLGPLVAELNSADVKPALVAPNARAVVKPSAQDVEVVTRQDGSTLYVIAVRRGGSTSVVTFTGLPSKNDGQQITRGEVLHEYVQDPPPPPIGAGQQVFRRISAANAAFKDWLGPHDARVYRFRQ